MYTFKLKYNVREHRLESKPVYNPQPLFFNPPQPHFYDAYNNPYRIPNYDFNNPKPFSSLETSTENSAGITSSNANSYSSLPDGKYGIKMKVFTYILFAYNILLTIAVIIYSSMNFDLDMLENSIAFFFLFALSEVFYISHSLRTFIKKMLDDNKCLYSLTVLISSILPFVSAMVIYTGFRKFPTGHYIIYIGGTSLLFSMSLVYFTIAFTYAMIDCA